MRNKKLYNIKRRTGRHAEQYRLNITREIQQDDIKTETVKTETVKTKLKRHFPTEETRKHVLIMVVAGLDQQVIADIMQISKMTLIKHYRKELTQGLDIGIAKMTETVYQQAVNGNLTAAMFILTKRGWKYGWGRNESAKEISVENVKSVIAIPDTIPDEIWQKALLDNKATIINNDSQKL